MRRGESQLPGSIDLATPREQRIAPRLPERRLGLRSSCRDRGGSKSDKDVPGKCGAETLPGSNLDPAGVSRGIAAPHRHRRGGRKSVEQNLATDVSNQPVQLYHDPSDRKRAQEPPE